jgi:ribosomal-protein-alanine N-acetyltransferase
MQDLQIRLVRREDLSIIHQMDQAAFGATAYTFVSVRQAYDVGGNCFFIGESAGEIVGYSLGAKTFGVDSGWLLDVIVAPNKQGFGYGRKLALKALETLEGAGAQVVRLVVQPSNTHAIKLYESLGFSEEGREPDYFDAGEQIVMARRIGCQIAAI